MSGELESSDLRSLLWTCAIGIVGLSSLTLVFGVSPVITLTIILSFLIILIMAGGCSLHLQEISRLEEAETLEKMRARIDVHLRLLDEVLNSTRSRLETCEAALGAHPGLLDAQRSSIASARRLYDGLSERMDEAVYFILTPLPENIIAAHDLCESKFKFSTDAAMSNLTPEPHTDLESHHWRDTIEMLLLQTEKQLRENQLLAA